MTGRDVTRQPETNNESSQDECRDDLTWSQVRRPAAFTVIALVALTLAALLGMWSVSPRHPSTSSVDAGFARDMTAHHAQAVGMSMTVRSRSTSSDVQTLSYDITTTQENQRGQMMAWLQQWELPLAVSGERMAWMRQTGHHHAGLPEGQMLLPDGRMPGMASAKQVTQLQRSTGKDAEILYLRLMIVHHQAGVEMAKAAVAGAEETQTVRLARTMVEGQQGEIDLMTRMLAKRGAKPWTSAQAEQEAK